MTLLDYVERAGRDNMAFHIECANELTTACNTTLTLLLTGGGASLAYGFTLYKETPMLEGMTLGVFAVASYLLVLAVILIFSTMRAKDFPAPANEPKNLYRPDLGLEEVRKQEIELLQERADKLKARNNETALWINVVRLTTVVTPAVFFLATGL